MFINNCLYFLVFLQGSADSNYSQPSSDLSLDEEKESLRREKEKQALNQLEKARVSFAQAHHPVHLHFQCYSSSRQLIQLFLGIQFLFIYYFFTDKTSSFCCKDKRELRRLRGRRLAGSRISRELRRQGVSTHKSK